MTTLAFAGARLFDGESFIADRALVVDAAAGAILAIAQIADLPAGTKRIDLDGGVLAPGFVDLQVNGGGGALFNAAPTPETIATIADAHARTGTTAILPTLITDTRAVSRAAIAAARAAIAARTPGCIGLHLEGPHLAAARKGAHRAEWIRPVDDGDLAMLAEAGLPRLLMTLAPETVPPETIRAIVGLGVTVSLGHSDAGLEAGRAAVDAGATGATHLFNAMSPFGHREPGLVGLALADGRLWCGLIADGHHVHDAAIRIALDAKRGPGRIFLVSDAMPTAGWTGDRFTLDGREVMRRDGRLTLADGTLAGADITLLDAVRHMVRRVGAPLAEALRMASLYPAAFLGLRARFGSLAPGARADLVHLSDELDCRGVWRAAARVT
jgi:N-acetylglucosamine-6-phosphate deacetylase